MCENHKFFDEAMDQSVVKTCIVTKYFSAWTKVIKPWAKRASGKMAYIDLFAGPGRYEDGARSTPLVVLEQAIADDDLRDMLVTLFNDADANHSRTLEKAIAELPGLESLKYKPQVANEEVGSEIVAEFEKMSLVPTLFFVDPWGYKGLSLQLINSVLKDWGCDCIFFFNYNRINMGLGNDAVVEHMNALFGEVRADELRAQIAHLTPAQRELAIVEAICGSLRDMGGKYTLPFRFKRADGDRTSHHLIFVSKHVRGYEIMKDIMARESSTNTQGVASFEYNPAPDTGQGLLFELSRPLEDLGDMLASSFPGQSMTMKQVFDAHHVDTPFVSSNYKDALNMLEEQGRIVADPPAQDRPMRKGKRTFGDKVQVNFKESE